jgi:hypothetical protein
MYTLSPVAEAHVQNGHLTPAGIVHVVYATVAIAVFVQFFFFTPEVSSKLIAGVGLLLLLHLFLGTHMALGLIGIIVPLDWYPGQPLKSITGWLTLIMLAIGVVWRYAKALPDIREAAGKVVERLVEVYMMRVEGDLYWRKGEIRTPRGLLNFLNCLGGYVLEVGFFVSAGIYNLRRFPCLANSYPDLTTAITCFWHALLPFAMVLVFGAVFFLSRLSAKQELKIVDEIFPSGRIPAKWPGSRDPLGITLSVIFFFVLYMALAWFAYDIRVVSFVMIVIASIDFNTRRMINKRFREYFADPGYAPEEIDGDREVIEQRRQVVRNFLFSRPHLWKEAGRVGGCAVAFSVAMAGYLYQMEWLSSGAYLILIATLVVNERVTWLWRAPRDSELRKIQEQNVRR